MKNKDCPKCRKSIDTGFDKLLINWAIVDVIENVASVSKKLKIMESDDDGAGGDDEDTKNNVSYSLPTTSNNNNKNTNTINDKPFIM